MRSFIALELPERFANEVAGLSRQLRASVEGRFMKPETYHLTLAFLGDASSADISAAMQVLDAARACASPVTLRCNQLGKFGKPRDATVWLGLERTEELEKLACCVRDGLVKQGVAFDRKQFKPHITLARRATLPKGALAPLAFPEPASASSVTLFKSELSREGATYKPLYTVSLEA